MALPVPSSMLNRAIPNTVPFTLSLPSSVVNTSFPTAVPSIVDTITLSVPVKLIASVVFGKVTVPFPESVNRIWVWFIGVWLKLICRSRRTGCGDSSNLDEDAGVVAVSAVVVAAAGAIVVVIVVVYNVTIISTASMKIVAAIGWL